MSMTHQANQKVSASHLKRQAYCYVRQSTLKQVFRTESGQWPAVYYSWIKWVVPIALGIILVGYIVQSVS